MKEAMTREETANRLKAIQREQTRTACDELRERGKSMAATFIREALDDRAGA
jgi:hypothetical protein